jgi:signal transduction histidine kinase
MRPNGQMFNPRVQRYAPGMSARFIDPTDLDHRILSQQMALMCRVSVMPLLGSVFIAAIVAYSALEDSGPLASVAWYAAAVAIMAVRLSVQRAFLRRPREPAEVRRWLNLMYVLIALFGAIWSIPPGFMLPKSPENEVIMSVMFIGATATGISSLSPVPHAYTLLLIPLTLPYGIHQFMMGGNRVWIGAAFVLYLPVMISGANRQTRSVAGQLRLAVENEALANALITANDELREQVTQHRLAADRIRKLNQDLESQASTLRTLNQDLEGFSYSVSHDLRAPLRAIDGFSKLLAERMPKQEASESLHYIARIRANITRMSTLIDDLLAFSHCGRQPVGVSELRMEELVRTAVNEVCSSHAGAPGIIPEIIPEIIIGPLPPARGDQGLMLQVWTNLIDNAVKYSSKAPQPRIIVQGREESDRLVYEVIDNGVGFDSQYSDMLFGVFQRLHGPREFPGSGVGLAIVQRIVVRHGGTVWARSELDHGATFAFSLPKTVAAPEQRSNVAVSAS